MYEIIDASSWERDEYKGKGSKEKIMLVEPETRRLVMFKYATEGSGDTWSEKIASEIGKCIGYNVQEVKLGVFNGIHGSLSYWFLERGDPLYEGADLVENDEFDVRSRPNLQFIKQLLDCDNEGLFPKFMEIVIFDILIGNTDRHMENWGIIKDENGLSSLAPAYDNSSSLGREFNSNPVKLGIRLKNSRVFEQYCKKGIYFYGWLGEEKIPHLKYSEIIYSNYSDIIYPHVIKLNKLTDQLINDIIRRIPHNIMTTDLKDFVVRFLIYRRNYLLNLIKGDNDEC